MIARVRQAALRLADATSITGKIMGIILGLTIFIGVGFTLYLRSATRLLLTRQLESRGLTIAQGVANQAIEPVLMGNEFILHSLLEETRQVNPDVRYVLVVSQQSAVLGDTFRRRIPLGLLTANTVSASGEPGVVPILTEEGMIRDIAYPLFGGRGGVVRVGMSEQLLQAELNKQTLQLLLATTAISLLGSWVSFQLSHVLARPIKALAAATQQVAGGDLSGKAPVFARDDIGQLAMAFNAMTDRLTSLLSELTDKQQVLTHLFDRAVSAQEAERRRISRELHDETSQSLTTLMLGLRSVEEATSPDELQQNVRDLRRRLTLTLDAVHQMARRLRPPALDDLGLKAALSRHIQEQAAQTGLDIDLDMDGLGEERLPPDVETAVYRITQEALANAIRHAAATEISVVLERQHGTVIALVEDNGCGFDVAAATHGSVRLGLSGMQERARLVGGTLSVESAPGAGTTVCLRVPVTAREGGISDAHPHSAG